MAALSSDRKRAPSETIIRTCEESDMRAVTEIYRHYVLHSPATFELVPPTHDEMLARYRAIREGGYIYLVAEQGGEIAGYAYISSYRARPAYRFTVENSVYVRPGFERRGLGRLLLQALLKECEKTPFRQVIAVIGDSANAASVELHRGLGFELTGTFRAVGFKFGRWVDTVMMQKEIGEGARTKPEA
jgi:phosphinothricin acetyltransferase